MSVKLLTEHHLEFLSLKGGCTGSSESKLVKMSHHWKSHVIAQLCLIFDKFEICLSNSGLLLLLVMGYGSVLILKKASSL